MRIDTDGNDRDQLYRRTASVFGENTKVGGIDSACRFSRAMHGQLQEALDHPDMTEELAAILDTYQLPIRYEIQTSVGESE